MLNYQFSKYIAAGILATFIGQPATFKTEATPEIPVETGSISVPLGIGYKSHSWSQGIPPIEATPQIPVETGTLIIPLGPEYRGRSFAVTRHPDHEPPSGKSAVVGYQRPHPRETFVGKIPPIPIVVVEADELANSRRAIFTPTVPYYQERSFIQCPVPTHSEEVLKRQAIYLPKVPYRGESFVGITVPPPSLVGDDAGIIQSRIASYIPPYSYSGKAAAVLPQVPEIITDNATQKARLVSVPIIGDRGKTFVNVQQLEPPPPPTPDEFTGGRRYVEQRGTSPYWYAIIAAYTRPQEEDEVSSWRRASYVPPLPYRGQVFIGKIPPPILVEADELTNSRRGIYAPIPPYRDSRYIYTAQPGEIDELLSGRRAIVVPKATYAGQSYTVLPPVPAVPLAEADELHRDIRRIYIPVVPYAPNLTRVVPIQTPAIVVVESPELTVARVRYSPLVVPYSTFLTHPIIRDLTLDEPPPTVIITGAATRKVTDYLIAPIRTPLYVRKLGNQPVVVIKDSDPWARWFADITKNAQKPKSLRVTLDFPPTAAQSYNDAVVTVIGAAIGNAVTLAVPPAAVLPNTSYFAFVSAANQVTIRFTNNHPTLHQDPPSGEFGILVQTF